MITFYKVLKYDFEEIARLVDETFHSRAQHKEFDLLYISQMDMISNPIGCALAVWTQTNLGFSKMIGKGFGYDRKGSSALSNFNRKNNFTVKFQERFKRVTIEPYDVLKIIKAYDSPDSFFYLDPPYVSSNQGHYAGYSLDDFKALLDACTGMKGKFLLSSYPEQILMEYREKFS